MTNQHFGHDGHRDEQGSEHGGDRRAGAMGRRAFGGVMLASAGAALVAPGALVRQARAAAEAAAGQGAERMRFGLVTYQWGADLDIPDLLRACRTGADGVELRTTHAHGVEPSLDPAARRRVRAQFEDAGLAIVGLGSDERFDSPDPAALERAMEATRAFLQLSHDVGGTGVKVKPDRFHDGVPRERTIEQIGTALRALGPVADGLGQELRLEVHGGCSDARVIDAIMRVADHSAVRVCWNSNRADLHGLGFMDNFDLLRPWFGSTLHVRELPQPDYPFGTLMHRLAETAWSGWVLLEAHSAPPPAEVREAAVADQADRRARAIARLPRDAFTDPMHVETHGDVKIYKSEDRVIARRRVDRLPVLLPLYAAGDRRIVRGFPLDAREGDSDDHPHHMGFWIAHGDVDGHDFWHDPACRVELEEERVVRSGRNTGVAWRCTWRAGTETILDEERRMVFALDGLRMTIEVELTLTPRAETVTFGDTKEGFFALRLAPTLRVDEPGTGRLVNEHGQQGAEAWGRRAGWIRAEGPVDERLVRVEVHDHPENPRHPTWWHARTYGLVAANPFGRKAFEGAAAEDGSLVVQRARPLRFRYRITTEVF